MGHQMQRRATLVILAILALIATAGHGSAQSMERIGGEALQALMQSWGYRADLTTDKDGDPMIKTGMAGVKVGVYFYSCKGEEKTCGSFQLSTGFVFKDKVPLTKVNEWNRKQRYMKAYLDPDEETLHVEYDLRMASGLTADYLKTFFQLYEEQLADVKSFFDYR
jgi:hypothetical protein